MAAPISEESMIKAFLQDKPHFMSFAYRKRDYKTESVPAIKSLLKKGWLKFIVKTTKHITYQYTGPQTKE